MDIIVGMAGLTRPALIGFSEILVPPSMQIAPLNLNFVCFHSCESMRRMFRSDEVEVKAWNSSQVTKIVSGLMHERLDPAG
jgi:hypothetical protein